MRRVSALVGGIHRPLASEQERAFAQLQATSTLHSGLAAIPRLVEMKYPASI
jgi:hypothetical protein